MKDVVIVGGGLAGLSAAWRLRHWDTQVLEAGDRVGGRIRSEKRGQYWLNWGGHMFAGPDTATAQLFAETGTKAISIPGSLTGMSLNGKFLTSGPIHTYALRFPMKFSARVEVMAKGARLGYDVLRYARAVRPRPGESSEMRQQRVYNFENDRTFADYIGPLSEDAAAFLLPTVTRSSVDIDELAAGAGIGYYSLIWNIGAGLNRYVLGGPSTLTETMAQAMRERVTLGAQVHEVVQERDHVVVRYQVDGVDHEVKARTAVLATPATVSHKVAVNLRADTMEALGQVKYGPLVSGAFLTNETKPMPYDNTYGMAIGKKSFIVALNHGNLVRGREVERQPGGSLMTFSSARQARALLEMTDEEINAKYLEDLDSVFPGFASIVEESHIARWPLGAPYCFPGRNKIQPVLTRPNARVFLAGDYLGTFYTDTAISSGFSAAQEAASLLATERQARARTA